MSGTIRGILIEEYMELKKEETRIKNELDKLKNKFEELNMDGAISGTNKLVNQVRQTVSLNESIKPLLKEKGILDACTSIDKSKVNAMIKAKILSKDEVSEHEIIKKSYDWVIQEIKSEEDK